MAVARSALAGAPGKLFFGAGTFWSGDSNITLNAKVVTKDIVSSMFGRLSACVIDGEIKLSMTPLGLWASMAVLFPTYCTSPTQGARIFGDTDVPAKAWLTGGNLYTLTAAAITKPPTLKLGPDVELFGDLEITGLIGSGITPETASSMIAITTAQADPGAAFAMTNYIKGDWTGVWGARTGFTAIVPQDFWEVECQLKLDPVKIGGRTLDMKVTGVQWMAKCKPVGPTMDQILTELGIQGTGAVQGRRLDKLPDASAAPDLTLTGPSSKSIVLNQASLVSAGFVFGDKILEAGEIGFVTTQEIVTGAAAAMVVISA